LEPLGAGQISDGGPGRRVWVCCVGNTYKQGERELRTWRTDKKGEERLKRTVRGTNVLLPSSAAGGDSRTLDGNNPLATKFENSSGEDAYASRKKSARVP